MTKRIEHIWAVAQTDRRGEEWLPHPYITTEETARSQLKDWRKSGFGLGQRCYVAHFRRVK